MQSMWDSFQYSYGYWQGRLGSFGLSTLVGKATNLISLPLPFLSLVAVPLFGGSSTRMSLVFVYLTWTILLLSHDPLTLEFYGTLFVRLIFYLLPALLFLAFDCIVPKLSKNVKARGARHLPHQLGRKRVLSIVGVAVGNVLLGVVLQVGLEWAWTELFHFRSLIKISRIPTMPLPWSVAIHLAQGFAVRGVSHYYIHRYVLHGRKTVLKTWHLRWHHSVDLPFSVVAAYDHPVNYLLCTWLPTVLPAYCFGWHALTWFTFLALTSLEELFIFSGYNVLPSAILLAGTARRIEAHFDSVKSGSSAGNFGHIGVMDYSLGTACKGVDIMDDVQDEAAKHRLQERIDSAVKAALESQRKETNNSEQSRSSAFLDKLGGRSGKEDASDGQRATRRSGRTR
ncbi:related to C-4 methyl sterol oxidase [Ramularia collo-cygni]|uniref:Related to C-4 methyl sterol oxidase n=1 Tax=Ramularia collo-cygni TaxID=112498 RepID=A0A2D3URA4_9PEZI|nr:related to C-4 methyl sterol oxidase [Ramularia collo-cygni]CZT17038.1 related to C-4 methyl sterol oxidase [Ramularia collo-cygni]